MFFLFICHHYVFVCLSFFRVDFVISCFVFCLSVCVICFFVHLTKSLFAEKTNKIDLESVSCYKDVSVVL